MDLPFATVVVLTANSMAHIAECLGTITDQSYQKYHTLVVDSNSSDDTVPFIRSHFPQVQVLSLDENLGYRRGNALGMRVVEGDYVVICNHDVEVERDWLNALVQAMEQGPSLGIATPKILFYDNRGTINEAGNTLHYTGTYGSRGIGHPEQEFDQPEELAAMSGCCFIIRRSVLDLTGGFSTDFDHLDSGWHASFEDVDLAWRTLLLGYRIAYVPTSVVYHKHERKSVTPQMFCSYEWGRHLLVLRNYGARSLALLAPLLILMEVLTWAYAAMKGRAWLRAKWKEWTWLLTNTATIRDMRAQVQSSRVVSDRVLVERMSPTIPIAHLVPWPRWGTHVERILNMIFSAYYQVFLSLLR